MNILSVLGHYWWILALVLLVVGYKLILRLFGMVIVPEDKIGIVTKKFVLVGPNKTLPDGRIIATKGEAGIQASPLAPGIHWGLWPWQFSIDMIAFTTIPQGQIGLIASRDGAPLPVGNILGRAVDCDNYQNVELFLNNGGQKGKQTKFLTAGTYRINTRMFSIDMAKTTVISENMVGVVTTLDGAPLDTGHIAGQQIDGHNNFQDFDSFLTNGGNRGLQPQVILAGSYYLNPWAVSMEETPMTEVPIGHVGVVISYIGDEGKDVSGDTFKHGNIVMKGQRGVCVEPLNPGKYPVNKYTTKVELVPTTNLVLNWASARTESHNLDKNLSTITVRSKDGFPFNLDVSQIIHVPAAEAPKVIARFGSMSNLVSQVLEPTIGNYFRNSAQDSDVISFLSSRKERQASAKEHIKAVLDEYNVNAVDTLIGDITPPESLMKTLTDRKIAEEEQTTYKTQKLAEEQRETLNKARAIADMQPKIVEATQQVEIAQREAEAEVKRSEGKARSAELSAQGQAKATELNATAEAAATKVRASAEAEQISKLGKAEAEKIEAIGDATAKAYKQQVDAMGTENFGKLKVVEQIATGNIKIIPDVLINGGGGANSDSTVSAILGLDLKEMLDKRKALPGVATN